MIGIYGGTFDPIHYGHLRTALEVKESLQLQKVLMIPSYQPPHRQLPSVRADQRLEMLRLALADSKELQADDRELTRAGPSYMVDTLQSLRNELGPVPLILIIGSDAFEHLCHWHQWQRLFDLAHIVVMHRPGSELNTNQMQPFFTQRLCKNNQTLKEYSAGKIYSQPVTQLDISSSQIRSLLLDQRNAAFLLPKAVLDYIKSNRLYQN